MLTCMHVKSLLTRRSFVVLLYHVQVRTFAGATTARR